MVKSCYVVHFSPPKDRTTTDLELQGENSWLVLQPVVIMTRHAVSPSAPHPWLSLEYYQAFQRMAHLMPPHAIIGLKRALDEEDAAPSSARKSVVLSKE